MKNSSPTRLLGQEIRKISNAVVDYLTPSITYIGEEDSLFEALKSRFVWIERKETYKAADSEVFIVKAPELTAAIVKRLPPRTILIIVHSAPFVYAEELAEALRRTLAVTLPNPGIDEITDTLRLLMMIREASYYLTEDCPVISVDDSYRKAMSHLIGFVTNSVNTVLVIDDAQHAESILEFLFNGLPKALSPIFQKQELGIRDDGRYQILIDPNEKTIQKYLQNVEPGERKVSPVLLVKTGKSKSTTLSLRSFKTVAFPSLNSRDDDCYLLSILASHRASHYDKRITYLTDDIVKEIKKTKTATTSVFFEESENRVFAGDGAYESDTVTMLLNKYNRQSLEDVVLEIENDIMDQLFQQLGSVEAVIHAAGMRRVTYYKKRQRYRERRRIFDLK